MDCNLNEIDSSIANEDLLIAVQEQDEMNQIDEYVNAYYSSPVRYHDILHDDMRNGEGMRVTLFLSGCSHRCRDCQNPMTWDEKIGLPFNQDARDELFEWLSKSWTQGLTLSGGDPLFEKSRNFTAEIVETVKKDYSDKDIWLYTGYSIKKDIMGFSFEDKVINESFSFPALKYIDVIVDGRFDTDVRKADIETGKKVLWCGSSNQRIIDVQESIKQDAIVTRVYAQDGSYQLLKEA